MNSEKVNSERNETIDPDASHEVLNPDDTFNPDEAKRQIEIEKKKRLERSVGIKVLVAASFDKRNDIVDSSLEKAQNRGIKLSGSNAERRVAAYLDRLEEITNNGGNRLENYLWDASVKKDNLVMSSDKIPESDLKDIQKTQRDSLSYWSKYFGSEDCPYPMWFKLFAWDGVTKMSNVFNDKSQHFAKRDNKTRAPYPTLNPGVLAKTYDAICEANGLNEEAGMETPTLNASTEKLIESGNFNRLYSLFWAQQKPTTEVPKNPEDVRGEWVEYDDADKLAEAAANTPWCVASPAVARHYLTKGEYDIDNKNEEDKDSKARFYCFHLKDENSNGLSRMACASIRLGKDGNVKEISGIREGQVLDDALIPIVKEKTASLPGGANYLKCFDDKQKLIQLGQKMKSGEDLTNDELRFVHEIQRPIERLEQYSEDPRIKEIKAKYPLTSLVERGAVSKKELKGRLLDDDSSFVDDITPYLDSGISANEILRSGNFLPSQDIDKLLQRNISHKEIIELVGHQWAVDNADYLSSKGFDSQEIASQLSVSEKLGHLNFLDQSGINYDLNRLIRVASRKGEGSAVLRNNDALLAHGAKINYNKIARRLDLEDTVNYADLLCANGAGKAVEKAVRIMRKEYDKKSYYRSVTKHLGSILNSKLKIDDLANIVDNAPVQNQVIKNLDGLLERGINPKIDMNRIDYSEMDSDTIRTAAEHPDKVDLKTVYDHLDWWQTMQSLDTLMQNGISVDVPKLAKDCSPEERLLYAKTFNKYGVDINVNNEMKNINGDMAYSLLTQGPEKLREIGIDTEKLIDIMKNDKNLSALSSVAAKPTLWRLGIETG